MFGVHAFLSTSFNIKTTRERRYSNVIHTPHRYIKIRIYIDSKTVFFLFIEDVQNNEIIRYLINFGR